jgi:predicted secreted protein
MNTVQKSLLMFALLVAQAAASADDEPRYNQVHLDAQVSEQVSNDLMHASLDSWGEQRDAAKLSEQINRDMEWALSLARQHAAVKVSTGSYRIWPLSSKDGSSTRGWRGQQSLQLESHDSTVLSQLAGLLQERLKMKSMNFTVSDERREGVENRLIEHALEAFKSRAQIVSSNLKASGYRIVNLNIGTAGHQPPVMYRSNMAMATMEAGSAVAVEAGESEVRVSVSGTVELVMP